MIQNRFVAWIYSYLNESMPVKRSEVLPLIWSFLYFFFLLSGYYVLRPIRDEMGIRGGVENLQWMFTGTFAVTLLVVPIFGWIVSNFQKKRIVPIFYYFFFVQILIFFILLKLNIYPSWTAIGFFIWLSVFNLFVVSVFWSFMIDIYCQDQSERLFGFIAAGGTTGAIVGPALTATLPSLLGTENLLLLSASLLLGAILSISRILRMIPLHQSETTTDDILKHQSEISSRTQAIGGHSFEGFSDVLRSPYLIGIGLFIVFYTTTSTFIYFAQAHIIEETINSSTQRTQIFSMIDFGVNGLTLVFQVFLTGYLMKIFGPGPGLTSLPFITSLGFLLLSALPVLLTVIGFQILRRASNYGLSKPGREVLFSPLNESKKYKGKNVIDTVLYRAGDAVTGWAFAGLKQIGLSISGIALIGSGLSAVWIVLSIGLISTYHSRHSDDSRSDT